VAHKDVVYMTIRKQKLDFRCLENLGRQVINFLLKIQQNLWLFGKLWL